MVAVLQLEQHNRLFVEVVWDLSKLDVPLD